MTDLPKTVCIPVHLDAFVLSPGSCDGSSSLAPFTQPNYTSLRLDNHLIQHDVLPNADFHLNSPAWRNPRLSDLGRSAGASPTNSTFLNKRQDRMGVHLSWSLPRFYRSGRAAGKQAQERSDATAQPKFPPFPNRWLVVRRLHNPPAKGPSEWQSWIVESDALRRLTEMNDMSLDLESETSPFVAYQDNANDANKNSATDPDLLKTQTEVFIGQKFNVTGNDPWTEPKAANHLPNLTVLSSSNPLFADYALHNINVLSMIDNFAYQDGSAVNYLEGAECDYFLLGWHANSADDPLLNTTSSQTPKDLASRLADMLLKLGPDQTDDDKIYGDSSPYRCLLHGAIYNVKYDFRYDPKKSDVRNIANESADKFTSKSPMEPLSVGTTPLDAMLTFMQAHAKESDTVFGSDTTTAVNLLLGISQLLYASGDNYDARTQAQDLLVQQNFSKMDGGLQWTFASHAKPGQPSPTPDHDTQVHLRQLNEVQLRSDAAARKLSSLRWQLFAEWWKYASKVIPVEASKDDITNIRRPFIARVQTLTDLIQKTNGYISDMSNTLKASQSVASYKQSASDPYHTRVDPTLCVAGLASGWPKDWTEKLGVRLHAQLATENDVAKSIFGDKSPIPDNLLSTAKRILTECVSNSGIANGKDQDPQKDGRYNAPEIIGFQSWGNRVPFVPIYLEWEGIYYHVGPMEQKWDVELKAAPVGNRHPRVKYTPTSVLASDDANHKDFRIVSGRVLILPQPVFSLEAVVNQVLDDAANSSGLSEADKQTIRKHIKQIQFVSAPLSGLTNHLLTRFEGSHVSPNVRKQGDPNSIPLTAAFQKDINMDGEILKLIESDSALTPYGDTSPFDPGHYPNAPFKPVTHGQMIFSKLNIIDKFGQAICMPKTLRKRRTPKDIPTSNIYPCMGDYVSPDVAIDNNGTRFLNTVLPDPKVGILSTDVWPPCQYVQLTPAINQNARINGSFMIRDTIDIASEKYTPWRQATDYDDMIFGWIIINYADNGLQLFLGDGTFYAEIRRGGVEGTNVGAKWLPYDKRSSGDSPQSAGEKQLAEFLEKLRRPDYFQRTADMINGSIVNMPFPPSDYSAYANSIVGKPLALVNVGWSLELAEPAIKSQNSMGKRPEWEGDINDDTKNVVPSNDRDPQNKNDWDARIAKWDAQVRNDFEKSDLSNYSFPLKLGDLERNYDGVVGYWLSENSPDKSSTDWQKVYTYFTVNWDHLPAGTVLNIPTVPPTAYTVITDDTLDSIAKAVSTSRQISPTDIKAANPNITDAVLSPDGDIFQFIKPSNFLQLKPFYLDPLAYQPFKDPTDIKAPPPSVPTVYPLGQSIASDRASKMKITTMLIDPYTQIHAYSPILPIKALRLPPRAIEIAFRKMHAFFHLGPILLTTDVPYSLEAAKRTTPDLTATANTPANTSDAASTPPAATAHVVKLPISGQKGTWNWFQPYATKDDTKDASGNEILEPTYAKLPVQEDQGQEKYVKGPYTFIEGFLELTGSLDQGQK